MITFQYLNSLDWKIFEQPKNFHFEAENNEYKFSLVLMREKINFFQKDNFVYLIIVDKSTNVSVFKGSEIIENLWNNLLKFCSTKKEEMLKLTEEL